jgi:8-oxo-dGTP pyrophosphatase MutT (NUDIX family)
MTPPAAAPAAPAATVVVARVVPDDGQGAFEVYLVKRHGRSGFMAGAHVFPGGRVDDDDAAEGADRFALAAIRETWEECGVLLARPESGLPLSTRAPIDAVAARSAAGEPFHHALSASGLVPDVEALLPIAWWITPDAEPKRFDTRFFFAVVPPLQRHAAGVDGHEVTEGAWLSPRAALDAYAAGTITLAPPTLVTLEELAAHATVDAVRAARWPLLPVRPILGDEDGRRVLALPGDPRHEVDDPVWPGRTRIVVDDQGRFRSACVRR